MAKLAIPFGNPTTYAGHSGIDFPVPRGTPFPASAPGRVTWLGWNAIGGYFIWVKYDAITPEVGYHHMDSHNGCPAVGSRVSEGTRLGYVGNSGRSTGPHLHSEVAENRTTDGYWKYFDRNRVVGAGPASSGSSTPAASSKPAASAAPIIEEDDMPVIITNSAKNEWSLLDPDVGKDQPRFTGTAGNNFRSEKVTGGVVNTYRGFMVTTSKAVADAWGRSYCRAYGNAPQQRLGGDYKNAQVEASRLASEKHR